MGAVSLGARKAQLWRKRSRDIFKKYLGRGKTLEWQVDSSLSALTIKEAPSVRDRDDPVACSDDRALRIYANEFAFDLGSPRLIAPALAQIAALAPDAASKDDNIAQPHRRRARRGAARQPRRQSRHRQRLAPAGGQDRAHKQSDACGAAGQITPELGANAFCAQRGTNRS